MRPSERSAASPAETIPGSLHIGLVTPSYPPHVGGLSRCTQQLAHGLVDRGHRVHVLVGEAGAPAPGDTASVDGLTVEWVDPEEGRWPTWPGLRDVRRTLAVRRALRRIHATDPLDVVEVASWRALGAAHSVACVAPQLLRSTTGIAEVPPEGGHWKARLADRTGRAVLRALEHLCLRYSDAVVVPTQAHRRQLPARVRQSAAVVPFGVPISPGTSSRVGSTVLYVGRLSYRKGFDLFAQAAARLLGQRSDVTVTIAGADLVDAGGSVWERHGLPVARRYPGRFCWLGEVDDQTLERLYRSSDVCAVPSRYESFGLVYVEAIGRGLPVVAWDVPVAREVCGDAALLVRTWDVGAFALALRVVLDPAADARPAAPVLEAIAARYSMETYLDRTEQLYRRLTQPRPAGRPSSGAKGARTLVLGWPGQQSR